MENLEVSSNNPALRNNNLTTDKKQLNLNNVNQSMKEQFLDKTANFIVNSATSSLAKNFYAFAGGACLTEVALGIGEHIHTMTKNKSDESDMLTPEVSLALLGFGAFVATGARMGFHWAKHRNDAKQEQAVNENRLDNNQAGLARF